MAKIHEEYCVVKLSKLVKDSNDTVIVTDDIKTLIEKTLEEYMGQIDSSIVVELEDVPKD